MTDEQKRKLAALLELFPSMCEHVNKILALRTLYPDTSQSEVAVQLIGEEESAAEYAMWDELGL